MGKSEKTIIPQVNKKLSPEDFFKSIRFFNIDEGNTDRDSVDP